MSVQSIILPTPKSALPQHDGKPVPWVTRWTGEVNQARLQVSHDRDGLHVEYADGNEEREAGGLLWKREGIVRRGTPQFSELNTYRQRAAMRKRLCQVCGTKINERPIRWLMAQAQLQPVEGGAAVTISPPTCSACIPLALELCPFLEQGGYVILKVLDYEPWGVYGEAVVWDEETGKGRDLRGVYVPYDNPPIPLHSVVAFQEVVRLTKYVIEKES